MKKKMIALMLALLTVLCSGCGMSGGKNSGKMTTLQNRTSGSAAVVTAELSPAPTAAPTAVPTAAPTPVPTTAPTVAPTQVPTAAPADSSGHTYADPDYGAAIIRQVMDYMGDDLIARGKEAGFKLSASVAYYVYTPWNEEWELSDEAAKAPKTQISFVLKSAIGSTMYGNNTVDCDLMRELQCAIIDSGVFPLSAEDAAYLKSVNYGGVNWADEYIRGDYIVNLHINETPSGYEAYLSISGTPDFDSRRFSELQSWSYKWDETITYKENKLN